MVGRSAPNMGHYAATVTGRSDNRNCSYECLPDLAIRAQTSPLNFNNVFLYSNNLKAAAGHRAEVRCANAAKRTMHLQLRRDGGQIIASSNDEEYDIEALLISLGFTKDEILRTLDELDAYRGVPGTTLRKYINRALETVDEDKRIAFLKGLIVGTAISQEVDDIDLEDHIDRLVAKRLKELMMEMEWRCS